MTERLRSVKGIREGRERERERESTRERNVCKLVTTHPTMLVLARGR